MTTQFFPVFHAQLGPNGPAHIEFLYPNTAVIGMTGEAPDAFDGAFSFNAPPKYPCVVITGSRDGLRHVPNRLLKNEDDLKSFRVEFQARDLWKYETSPAEGSHNDALARHERNQEKRRINKLVGDKAIAAL